MFGLAVIYPRASAARASVITTAITDGLWVSFVVTFVAGVVFDIRSRDDRKERMRVVGAAVALVVMAVGIVVLSTVLLGAGRATTTTTSTTAWTSRLTTPTTRRTSTSTTAAAYEADKAGPRLPEEPRVFCEIRNKLADSNRGKPPLTDAELVRLCGTDP